MRRAVVADRKPAALTAHAASHAGRERGSNEDRLHCDAERGIFIVVDGLGGHAAGERAADTAVSVLRARLVRASGAPAERLRDAITLANNEIHRLATAEPAWAGMACVLTAVLVHDGHATVGHVGDTRLYRFRHGTIRKVTRDHSPVGEREDRGEIGELDAMRHPRRHEVFRDVGSARREDADVDFVEIAELPFEADSALLLCTDGLSDRIGSDAIARIVHEHAGDGATVVERLVDAANAAGGQDNVSVVYVEGPGFRASTRRWLARAGGRVGLGPRLTASRPAWLAGGALAGLVAAYVAFSASDRVADRLLTRVRPAAWSRTWTVGPESGADASTIAGGLKLAAPGDTIRVAPGIYREQVVIDRSVTLASTRGREAIIAPPDGAAGPWTAVEVRPGVSGRLAGFTIAGDETRPMAVGLRVGDSTIRVEEVEVRGAAEAGILVLRDADAVLQACYVHDNRGVGVRLESEATPSLLHNVITRNGGGLVVGGSARPLLFGNVILRNAGEDVAGLAADALVDARRDNILALPPPLPAPGPARRGATGTTPR